jgi:hypothetical protein
VIPSVAPGRARVAAPLLHRCCTVAALRMPGGVLGPESNSDLAPEQGFEP